jgi:two-component system chemotaxis response regulator CheB
MNELTEKEAKLLEAEVRIASNESSFELGILDMGDLTALTCPECSGALVSFKEGHSFRFRCHTGHAFTASALLAGITKEAEEDLYKVIRGLEEAVMLLEKIGHKYEEAGDASNAELFFKKAKEIRKKAAVIRDLALKEEKLSEDIRLKTDHSPLTIKL